MVYSLEILLNSQFSMIGTKTDAPIEVGYRVIVGEKGI